MIEKSSESRLNLVRLFATLALVFLTIVLSGCPNLVKPKPSVEDTGEIEERTNLFVEDGDNPGTFRFLTNNPDFWSERGYTLWASTGNEQNPFTRFKVTVTKADGDKYAGYGIVLCQYDTGDPQYGVTMIVVMINTEGEYIAGEVVDGSFYRFFDWTSSPALNNGYGVPNTIEVTQDTGKFYIYLNGVLCRDFRDDEAPYHTYGKNGFIVVISPQDHFPADYVDVTYKIE